MRAKTAPKHKEIRDMEERIERIEERLDKRG